MCVCVCVCVCTCTPGVVNNFKKAVCACIVFLSPMHKKIPDSYSKREGVNLKNSGTGLNNR